MGSRSFPCDFNFSNHAYFLARIRNWCRNSQSSGSVKQRSGLGPTNNLPAVFGSECLLFPYIPTAGRFQVRTSSCVTRNTAFTYLLHLKAGVSYLVEAKSETGPKSSLPEATF